MAGRVAAVIPAHNEAEVITGTIEALKRVMPEGDVYLVNDRSDDDTLKVACKLIKNIYTTPENVGKAIAINMCIDKFQLVEKYEFIMPVDADTRLAQDFMEKITRQFDSPGNEELIAIAGRVVGSAASWLTAYRVWEYEIGQTIHKRAQSYLNAITVCPGCATVYRSKVFKELEMPVGTLTEDMDLTFQIHRSRLGRIAFNSKAIVYTQDPNTLQDLIKQLDRWYVGLWQNISKHNAPFGRQRLDFELALLATEGLLNGLFMASLAVVIPLLLYTNPSFLLLVLGAELIIFSLPSLLYVMIRNDEPGLIKYLLHFLFIRVVSSIIFLFAFLKVVIGIETRTKWQSPSRYKFLPLKA